MLLKVSKEIKKNIPTVLIDHFEYNQKRTCKLSTKFEVQRERKRQF